MLRAIRSTPPAPMSCQRLIALLLVPLASLLAADAPRPNIILILADDLGYGSLGSYGHEKVKTPHIDRLAASGARLTDFHSNGAMCTPTRAALMTGRYQQRCAWVPDEELTPLSREQRQLNPKQRWAWGVSAHEVMLPTVLGRAGYRTALIGKWHLGYDPKFHPMNHGFDEFRGFVGGNVDYHSHVAGYGDKTLDWWRDRQKQDEPGYATDLLTRHATDFIRQNKAGPFFLYLAHGAPHEPWQGRDPAKKRSAAVTYQEMIETLDESVGAVLSALHEHGLEKKTLVIFCSDNGPDAPTGFRANGALQGKKGSMFEGGHRVPCVASWPGVIPGGLKHDATAMTMDFLPTFAKLAGATLPAGYLSDGVDLLPSLKDGAKTAERALHWQHDQGWAVRKGPWKLIGKGQSPQVLVNLDEDLSEKVNRMQQNPGKTDELTKLHRDWLTGMAGER